MPLKTALLALFCALCGVQVAFAQDLPRCSDRPTQALSPRVDNRFCLELAVYTPEEGEMAFFSLAFAPDGTLYASRPLRGQVVALRDSDGDALLDRADVVLEGLDLPAALLWHEDALLIATEGRVLRWHDGALETLISDLPPSDFLHTALTVWGGRLYVGVGACRACGRAGEVRAYPLAGEQTGEVVMRLSGVPLAFAVLSGELYVSELAPEDTPDGRDALYRVGESAPVVRFARHVAPIAFVPYRGEAFPFLSGQVLMLHMGQANSSIPLGYDLTAIAAQDSDPLGWAWTPLAPRDDSIVQLDFRLLPEAPSPIFYNPTSEYISRRGAGFYPHLLYSVAVSPEGWVYLALSGGRLYALRNH